MRTIRIVIILYEASSFSTRHPDRLSGKSKIAYKRRNPYLSPLINSTTNILLLVDNSKFFIQNPLIITQHILSLPCCEV